MLTSLKSIKQGISEVIFPHVCVICGLKLSESEEFVCPVCIKDRFDLANTEGKQVSSNTILPEGITLQHALWNFDKGGFLQELLHSLKYHRLTGLGVDLGVVLANSVRRNPFFRTSENSLLIPVPLHPKKRRTRGYNQARFIAEGVKAGIRIPICSKEDVVRIKNTETQTGFTLEKRRNNIDKAFLVNNEQSVRGKECIIVDDVFTTGATAFELANTLQNSGADKIMIITVAQA
ncbi:MAG: ComF family protein [Balneolaceae bacterium]